MQIDTAMISLEKKRMLENPGKLHYIDVWVCSKIQIENLSQLTIFHAIFEKYSEIAVYIPKSLTCDILVNIPKKI